MTEAEIARELGITRHEVAQTLDRALWKVARALTHLDREPSAILGPKWRLRVIRRRHKRCGRCGSPGHQANTCGRRPFDGNDRRGRRA